MKCFLLLLFIAVCSINSNSQTVYGGIFKNHANGPSEIKGSRVFMQLIVYDNGTFYAETILFAGEGKSGKVFDEYSHVIDCTPRKGKWKTEEDYTYLYDSQDTLIWVAEIEFKSIKMYKMLEKGKNGKKFTLTTTDKIYPLVCKEL